MNRPFLCLMSVSLLGSAFGFAKLPDQEKPEQPPIKAAVVEAPYRPATIANADLVELRAVGRECVIRWTPIRKAADPPRRRTYFPAVGSKFGVDDRFEVIAIGQDSVQITDASTGTILKLKKLAPIRVPWKP